MASHAATTDRTAALHRAGALRRRPAQDRAANTAGSLPTTMQHAATSASARRSRHAHDPAPPWFSDDDGEFATGPRDRHHHHGHGADDAAGSSSDEDDSGEDDDDDDDAHPPAPRRGFSFANMPPDAWQILMMGDDPDHHHLDESSDDENGDTAPDLDSDSGSDPHHHASASDHGDVAADSDEAPDPAPPPDADDRTPSSFISPLVLGNWEPPPPPPPPPTIPEYFDLAGLSLDALTAAAGTDVMPPAPAPAPAPAPPSLPPSSTHGLAPGAVPVNPFMYGLGVAAAAAAAAGSVPTPTTAATVGGSATLDFASDADVEEMFSDLDSDDEYGDHGDVPLFPSEVTPADLARGLDIQGIDWAHLQVGRDEYRAQRNRSFQSYRNTSTPITNLDQVATPLVSSASPFYTFRYTHLSTKCSHVHFQLRNVVWAPTNTAVVYTHDLAIRVWDVYRRTSRVLVDCFGDARVTPCGPVRLATLAAGCGVVAAGGYHGELVVKGLDSREEPFAGVLTHDANGITNQMEVAEDRAGNVGVLVASNDQKVRRVQVGVREGKWTTVRQVVMPWAVHCVAQSPDRRMLAVAGDGCESNILDAQSGQTLYTLTGHVDYSFASAWSHDGYLVATGNQDRTARIYDIRFPSKTLHLLAAHVGAVRSIRFSPDRHLFLAEDADYVTVVDTTTFRHAQVLDFFGEIAGIAISPDAASLFVGNADEAYGSILEFAKVEEDSGEHEWARTGGFAAGGRGSPVEVQGRVWREMEGGGGGW
ncbi:hypothetical protein AMAG_03951 [Allomyces macrogynus ATCC 38327]|uniref:DUF2415 domain-containing protein n=1 Tax=Allomyces macrogynus (strain ATCC 38327) TaxID=578462 RepID=A0A0L0S6Y7_ALLM3|nr:hypothetical protein AMAG_03951 [Allomyces macrogynus ATCC 38327]|eukprot:KNE58368.1 hypothetical protein AMAG_03951 [Allomyces macrogynus ATCC 38327]